jgi:nickel-type superoxide dismutase maturation protease
MLRYANWHDRILFLLGRRAVYRVAGNSMLPGLKEGDTVMIDPRATVIPGDIVLAAHPFKSSVKMLKRVSAVDTAGRYTVVGDNLNESTDSRAFGTVPIECIHGKAVCRLKLNDRGKSISSTVS